MAAEPENHEREVGLNFRRVYTKPGVHPYDEIEWERRTARITNEKGDVIFERKDVEVPAPWSMTATNVVVSKYFRGARDPASPARETSVRQLVDRVAKTIAAWGRSGNYFASPADAQVFEEELTTILVRQLASFNSPVWFNVGIEPRPQASACFINSVKDTMESILDLAKTEGLLFKHGSGTGTNLSPIRSSRERLSGGGEASGPVSFMKGYDSFASVIKSGGKTRRAAKMVILNADHPDIVDFIRCKEVEEKKAWALIDAGYDGSFGGEAYASVFFQNSNNSVRVTDDFMSAVNSDGNWSTRSVLSGQPMDTYRARELMRMIGDAAWVCGDPGMQFHTTINDWHTCPNSAPINASNPCVTGDTLVATPTGLARIADLVGRPTEVMAGDGRPSSIAGAFRTGTKPVFLLRTRSGYTLKLTADHRVQTVNRGDVPATHLTIDDVVRLAPAGFGEERLSAEVAEIAGLALGDGCVSGGILTIAMAKEERAVLEKAAAIANSLTSNRPRPNRPVSVTETETTARLATNADELVDELTKWTVLDTGSEGKRLTDRALQLDRASLAALLRGLFTSDGTVANYGARSHYVALDSTSLELLRQVQALLLGFGIKAKVYENRRALGQTTALLPDGKGGSKDYPVQQIHSLRISRSSRLVFEREIGFIAGTAKADRLRLLNESVATYADRLEDRVESLNPAGVEDVYDLTEPRTSHFVAGGIVVHNCSEYMFLDDSACNLSSLNLMKFRDEAGEFDVERFRHAVRVMITAQEILVDNASYPTKAIEKNSHDYRPLGLGYANLGALLIARGVPYDSDPGRAISASITALMCGEAYRVSAEIASRIGPFAGYARNREPMLRVIAKHRRAVDAIEAHRVPGDLHQAAKMSWDRAYELGEMHGYRNSQVTVLAPTGTIGFMMDCDTTGIEPELALVKYKKLVGGGYLKIVNQTVAEALDRLGYPKSEQEAILQHIDQHATIEGAPHLKEEHLPVFDCALAPAGSKRSIHYMGHVRMMAAVQPFLSGAISKTVNMPTSASVDEIVQTYVDAHNMGLKSIAIYRDGCKRTQPLSTTLEDKSPATVAASGAASPGKAAKPPGKPTRRRLPDERKSMTHKFTIGGHEGYITVGMYEDGSPGELFITMAKEGSVVSGLMDCFATAGSIALQYGVPLEVLIKKFRHTRFEPSGWTNHPHIPFAKSIMDYLFRWLALKFLPESEKEEATTPGEETRILMRQKPRDGQSATPQYPTTSDAPPCPNCGSIMVMNGACHKCPNCGEANGCSG